MEMYKLICNFLIVHNIKGNKKTYLLICFCMFDLSCPILKKDIFTLQCLVLLNSVLFLILFVSIRIIFFLIRFSLK